MQDRDAALRAFAAAHGGVVTRTVLDEAGFDRNQILGRVRRRGWRGLGRGAYQIMPARDHLDVVRGALAVLENAVASHETAAELHDMPLVPRGLSVVSVHSRTTHRYPGCLVHRMHDMEDEHVTVTSGLRVTTPERTVMDLARDRSSPHIGRIVDDLVSRRVVRMERLSAVLESVGRRGRPGTAVMREVLDGRAGETRPQSELERRARDLIRRSGIPIPISEYAIPWAPHRRFDDAYPRERVALEWDSRRFHGQLDAFDADRERDRTAAINGWRLLRFTWADVTTRPHTVIDTIWTVLR